MSVAAAVHRTPIALIKQVWERIAPLKLAETSWDNVGVIIESPFPRPDAKHVLLTIDLTTAVCNEALALPSCSVIIAYHPPIFRALKNITMNDPLQASLLKLAASGISVFSPHTSLDATPNGINTWLTQPFLPLSLSSEPITLSEQIPGFEGAGMGKLVQLKDELSITDAVKLVKQHLGLTHVQLATPVTEAAPIKSIAVCAGSGGSLFRGVQADLFITGEMSHHEVLAAIAQGQSVILCNHTNTERPYLSAVLKPWLEKELEVEAAGQGWTAVVSQSDADPLRVV